MILNDAFQARKMVAILQLISAIMLMPLSLILCIQKGTVVLLGGNLQGSARAAAWLLWMQNQGAIILGFLTLFGAAIALYLSLQLFQKTGQSLLWRTLILQVVLGIAEGLKVAIAIQANWISILISVFVVGFLLKPQGQAMGQSWRAAMKRFGQAWQKKKKNLSRS